MGPAGATLISPAWSIAVGVPVWLWLVASLGGQSIGPLEGPIRALASALAPCAEGGVRVGIVAWALLVVGCGAVAWRVRPPHAGRVRALYAMALPVAAGVATMLALVPGLPDTLAHTAAAPAPVGARIAALLGIGSSVSGGLVLAAAREAARSADAGESPPPLPARWGVLYGLVTGGTALGAALLGAMG